MDQLRKKVPAFTSIRQFKNAKFEVVEETAGVLFLIQSEYKAWQGVSISLNSQTQLATAYDSHEQPDGKVAEIGTIHVSALSVWWVMCKRRMHREELNELPQVPQQASCADHEGQQA